MLPVDMFNTDPSLRSRIASEILQVENKVDLIFYIDEILEGPLFEEYLTPSKAAQVLLYILDAKVPLELRRRALTAWRGALALLALVELKSRGESHRLTEALSVIVCQGAVSTWYTSNQTDEAFIRESHQRYLDRFPF